MTNEVQYSGLVQQLSRYFEIFLWIFVVLTSCSVLLFIFLKGREASFKKIFRTAVQNVLFALVAVGQLLLFLVVLYLFWMNYKHAAPAIQFPEDVLADTSWVREDFRIYFIDGNQLRRIRLNGRDKHDVLIAPDPIKEYLFSPDGKHLLVATTREIYLLDPDDPARGERIDSWQPTDAMDQWSGAVSGIRWSPDSRRFCYEIARWSSYSAQNSAYVYDIMEKKKRAVQAPTRRLSSLYWDRSGENLYYLQTAAKDTSVHAYPFEVNVFRIPLVSLRPEFVTRIPRDRSQIPIGNLRIRGIDLNLETDELSFRQGQTANVLVSDKGRLLGIDEDDYLYYVPKRWFRNRLLKISREPRASDLPRHPYQGGELTITQIRWIPGGRYAIMFHRYLGVLILEPATRKLGLLIAAQGNTFGWYAPNIRQQQDFIPLEESEGEPSFTESKT